MDYLIKASAVLIIFYICYQLFLQRETFFQANRWFLLSGLIMACCIPLVVIPIYIEYTPIETPEFIYTTTNITPTPVDIQESSFDYTQLIFWMYFAGILFFCGKLIVEFLSLKRILSNSKPRTQGSYKLLETKDVVAPFSFFNHIVYNPDQFKNEELDHVINHEMVHTKQLHSIDTIIAQLSCIIFWFNPIVWLYKKALQQNLEFIADQKAQYISKCQKSYQTVLLKASVQNHQLTLTNNFYTSLIKKRIIMLHKSKSHKLNQLKFALVLPILGVFMMSFSTENVYIETPLAEDEFIFEALDQISEDIEIIITKDTTDEELKTIQSELKKEGITFDYSGVKRNDKGEITSIKTDFKNDKNSSNYNIKGDDGIKPFRFKSTEDSFSIGTIDNDSNTFVFESKDGTAKVQSTGSNVYVFESDDEEEDNSSESRPKSEEDVKTIVYRTKTWTNKDGEKITIDASEKGNSNVFITRSEDPIFIIDGSAVDKSIFENVDSEDIQSVNVLKGKNAQTLYGTKAKNGVVIMTTKGSKNTFTNEQNSKGIILKTNGTFIEDDGQQPLFIIDGKTISKKELEDINPNNIESIDIIKDDKAIKAYGKKAKNGAVIVRTHKNNILTGDSKPVIVEIREESPNRIETAVSSVYIVNDNDVIETIEFVISKNSSDAFLDKQKKDLKAQGIDAKFSKVRRNKAGEITSIKISLNDNNGRKSSATWRDKDEAIPDIVMGKSKDDKLFVRAIGY
ncbi:M56 family metallopeptidase [uncultured Psychroserpens sp.]|uniref:M56 family metallopeptidase n=1 Tax=uncultured Psychroserpens sp. TaxID=255436 RepID=UPI002626D3F5|nr:M56 family metallopeptidase [uncultured Psychroserpens sp.]